MNDLLDLLERFQTAIVGIIGFAGVIVTLRTNARIAREGREHAISNDRRALRLALIEELKVLKTVYEEGAKSLGRAETDGGTCMVPTDPLDAIYQANAGRLGLLTADEIEKLLGAYLSARQLQTSLLLIAPKHQDRFLAVPASKFAVAKGMYESMLPRVNEALDVLRKAHSAAG